MMSADSAGSSDTSTEVRESRIDRSPNPIDARPRGNSITRTTHQPETQPSARGRTISLVHPPDQPRWSPLEVSDETEGALILVVDDNPRNVDVLVKLLSVRGYEPAVASSGERAIELATKIQPSLILLDVEMPGMSGFNACRILTAQPETQHIPIIFVTGHTGQIVAALEAGAVDFIPKPVQAADLYARVGSRLRMEALQREIRSANDALKQVNAHLEDRVAERTAELERANADLHNEINLRQLVSDRLDYISTHDPLTRLPNYATFTERASELTSEANGNVSYVRVEIDRIDLVRARHGEHMVELILSTLATAIRSFTGANWVAGRIGTSALAMVSAGADEEATRTLMGSIMERFERDLADQNLGVTSTAIAGAAVVNDIECSLSDLDHAAKEALSEATEIGAGVVFSRSDSLVGSRDTTLWLDRIVEGVQQDSFVLFGQPVVALGKGHKGQSYELLIRWKDPSTGAIVPPGVFLPIAERHRLMGDLDRWAVSHAISMLNSGDFPTNTTLAVNLSGQSLSDIGFGEWLIEAASMVTTTSHRLTFEITEQSAVRHIDRVQQVFSRLHEQGHRLSLDDFGTGFASYSYLKAMPVDSLKIDRSFIVDVCTDPVSAEMVRSMNELGHALGLTTVAEGVETQEILDFLIGLGVDFAQGWHLGRPAPLFASGDGT